MPETGGHTHFEIQYRNKLKALLASDGLLVEYEEDLAALDLGLHIYLPGSDPPEASLVRVWMQAKGLRTASLDLERYRAVTSIAVSKLDIDTVQYWYSFPEPVYIVLYIESADEFLAADIREIVDARGGVPSLRQTASQREVTIHVPKVATLAQAVGHMPRHRSMRIDGPSFRGRPLGHRLDPLRSELHPLKPSRYLALVHALLGVHDFRPSSPEGLKPVHERPQLAWTFGRLTYTYEWAIPLFTEFGYDAGSDFRIEGQPFCAQGEVLVVIAPQADISISIASTGRTFAPRQPNAASPMRSYL
jgi:hypothetical protein